MTEAQVRAEEREACAAELSISRADLQLACGEMTAQEWLTVLAVLRWLQTRMHSKLE